MTSSSYAAGLEAAAKAVCFYCKQDVPFTSETQQFHVLKGMHYECKAKAIRALAAAPDHD